MNMTSDDVEALSEEAFQRELVARGIAISLYPDKGALVRKALSL